MKEKIRDWLNKQGYPLELKIASALQKESLFPTLANYYLDPTSNKSREIDIIGGRNHVTGFLNIELVIECKRSAERPWLVLSAENSSDGLGPLFEYALTSGAARAWLGDINNLEKLSALHWWNWDGPRGVGIIPAFKENNNDDAFKAIAGAMAASIARKKMWMERTTGALVFVFPIAFLDNELYECKLTDSGQIEISKIDEAKIYLPMHYGDEIGTCVHVVTSKRLDYFCKSASRAIDDLERLCEPEARRLLKELIADR